MSDRQDDILDMLLGELPADAERDLCREVHADPELERGMRGLQGLLGDLL